MRKTLVGFMVGMAMVLPACGSVAESPAESRPGSPAVYQEIEAMTDCSQLQEKFDIAATHNDGQEPGTDLFSITLSYMEFTNERMKELSCP